MVYEIIKKTIAFIAAVGFVLSTPPVLPPVFAQEKKEVKDRLETVDPEEAVAVMRAAVVSVFRDSTDRKDGAFPAGRVRVDPAGILSSSFSTSPKAVPQKARSLAQDLAAVLGTETSSFEESNTETEIVSFIATSVPKIRGWKARVVVRDKTTATGGRLFGVSSTNVKLERGADGQWQVTKEVPSKHVLTANYDHPSWEASYTAEDGSKLFDEHLVDKKPQIIGGKQALYKALRFPEEAPNSINTDRVAITFVVGTDGQAHKIEVKDSSHQSFAEEAKRAIKKMRFKPGRHDGKAVPVHMVLAPVKFER